MAISYIVSEIKRDTGRKTPIFSIIDYIYKSLRNVLYQIV